LYELIDSEIKDLESKAKSKKWKTSPQMKKVNAPERITENCQLQDAFGIGEKPNDASVSDITGHQATAAGTSKIGMFSTTAVSTNNN
jgi:hypothetical protein